MQGLVPTVLLGEWELECLLFDRDSIARPVPTLFMANREASRKALDGHDKRVFQDSSVVAPLIAHHLHHTASLPVERGRG